MLPTAVIMIYPSTSLRSTLSFVVKIWSDFGFPQVQLPANRINQHHTIMDRLATIAASSAGADRLFMLMQYSITLILPSIHDKQTHSKLQILRDLTSDYRIFARLIGYPAIHTWAVDTFTARNKGTIQQSIEKCQVVVNLLYQPLENLAYLSSHKIITLSKQTEDKLWRWSCQCWAAHVFMELYRLHLINHAVRTDQKRKHMREIIINLAYAPLTVHWSMIGGIGLSERSVGALGLVAALGQMSKLIDRN